MALDAFAYDVFLSHTSADKMRARSLAERLRAAGLRVWFDEWSIKPGDDIYLAIEKGLEDARVQVLCLSAAALGSAWVSLERSSAIFRDPANVNRRFVPVLLEDCQLPDGLRRYRYIDFRRETGEVFEQLLATCRPETPPIQTNSLSKRRSRRKTTIETQRQDAFTLSSAEATRALRWGHLRQFSLGQRLLQRTACAIITTDPYFRFGFKLLTSDGQLFGPTTLQCQQPELLIHIGRNDFSRAATGITSNDIFLTCYLNGDRTDPDRPLFSCESQVSTRLTLTVDANDLLELHVADALVFSTHIRTDLRQRLVVMGWADSAMFNIRVEELVIESVSA